MLADSFITLLITIAALYFPFVYYLFTEPSFTRALDWLEILIIPGLAPLIIVTELFFNGNLPEWLTFLLAGFCQFACWLAIFLGYQRSKWWLVSATVLTFGMSSFSYFVVHGLWSM